MSYFDREIPLRSVTDWQKASDRSLYASRERRRAYRRRRFGWLVAELASIPVLAAVALLLAHQVG